MALGLHKVIAQKVLASVNIPHLKAFQGEERFSGGWRFGYIVLCGCFSSLETAFTFLYDSDALSTGLV